MTTGAVNPRCQYCRDLVLPQLIDSELFPQKIIVGKITSSALNLDTHPLVLFCFQLFYIEGKGCIQMQNIFHRCLLQSSPAPNSTLKCFVFFLLQTRVRSLMPMKAQFSMAYCSHLTQTSSGADILQIFYLAEHCNLNRFFCFFHGVLSICKYSGS